MLVKLISQKGFLVKIGVLLMLLVLGRGLRENSPVLASEVQVMNTKEAQTPLVLTTANSVSIFPSAELSSSIN